MRERLPKHIYFAKRLKQAQEAGNTRKAAYYERRLQDLKADGSKRRTAQEEGLSEAETIRRAVKVLQAPTGTVQQKIQYLTEQKGLTMTQVLEAMNQATDGGLIAAALG